MFSQDSRLGLRTWIEVSKKAIEHNYNVFRSLIKPETKLMSVVKSNAYGHGLVDFSKVVDGLGIDWFAVDSIVEGLKLRKEGITKPILVVGYTLLERMQEAIDSNISITISNMYILKLIKSLKWEGVLNVHIKVDTGMHRQGFMIHEMAEVIALLHESKDLIHVEGLFTHFAAAKSVKDPAPTQNQIEIFNQWVHAFREGGFTPIKHAAATGATLLFPEAQFDMVRVGIGFHGIWPSDESEDYMGKKIKLMPTLSWKTIISETKRLPAGEKIGYDFTEEMKRDSTIGICPIGYWHGIPRSLSSVGEVLVNGHKARILGRVSMDMICIDLTDIPEAKIGDEVVVIGEQIPAYYNANKIQMSVYEFITRINPLIKKIYY